MEEIALHLSHPLADADLLALFRAAWPAPKNEQFGHVLERSLCWVSAHAGQRLVGFVNVAWDGGVHAFLLDPTVHPDYQRHGLGIALVRRAAAEAQRRGLEWLHVDYEARLTEFYRRCGFRPTAAGVIHLVQEAPTVVSATAGVSIRRFEPRDRAACEALMEGLGDWFGIPTATSAYVADLDRLPSWVATLPAESSPPEGGGEPRVVGLMSLALPQPNAFEVHVLAVDAGLHRRGVGRALSAHAEGWAFARGGRLMQVKTLGASCPDPAYEKTRAFYLALGYQPLFETDKLWGEGNPTLILVKALR